MIKFFLTILFLYYSVTISANEQTIIQGLHILKGDSIELPASFFSNSKNNRSSENPNISNSKVWLTYFTEGLKFNFECNQQNTAKGKESNKKHVKSYQEIFQISLSHKKNNFNSFEFKLNPNSEISVYKDNGINSKKINAKNSGIRYGILNEGNNSWSGWIFIPFSLIGKAKKYKLSFVRIIKIS